MTLKSGVFEALIFWYLDPLDSQVCDPRFNCSSLLPADCAKTLAEPGPRVSGLESRA